jgi:hypothetical protein
MCRVGTGPISTFKLAISTKSQRKTGIKLKREKCFFLLLRIFNPEIIGRYGQFALDFLSKITFSLGIVLFREENHLVCTPYTCDI